MLLARARCQHANEVIRLLDWMWLVLRAVAEGARVCLLSLCRAWAAEIAHDELWVGHARFKCC